MQPEPKKPEVVYRKTPDPGSGASSSFERGPGYAPATVPLIVGFLLLLGLILVVGMKSANQMPGVSSTARNLTIQYSTQVNRLIDARLKVIKLNTEARVR